MAETATISLSLSLLKGGYNDHDLLRGMNNIYARARASSGIVKIAEEGRKGAGLARTAKPTPRTRNSAIWGWSFEGRGQSRAACVAKNASFAALNFF